MTARRHVAVTAIALFAVRTSAANAGEPAGVAVAPPAATTTAAVAGGPRAELLAVTLNGQSVSEGSAIVRDVDGVLYAPADEARTWRIHVAPDAPLRRFDGVDYVAISGIDGLEPRIDAASQTLALVVGLTRLEKTVIRNRFTPLDAVGGNGAFFNYDLRFDRAGRNATDAARFDLGTFVGGGLLETEANAIRSGASAQVRAQYVDWTRLDTRHQTRWRAGSMQATGGVFGDGLPLTGIAVDSDRETAPGLVAQPIPVLEGVASGPSLVQIYADGALVGSATVPPGPFSLQPAVGGSGARTYSLVVTDAAGHRSVVQTRAYLDATLLPRGKSEFAYTLGSRRTFDQHGEGGAVVEASRRVGITDHLTAEADVEAGFHRLAGVEVTWAPGARIGTLIAGGALSSNGNLSDLGYRFAAGRLAIAATSRLFSAGPPVAGIPAAGALRESSVSASFAGARGIVAFETVASHDLFNRARSASLVYQRPSPAGNVAVRLSRAAGVATSSWQFDVAIVRHLGARAELTTAFGHGGSKGNDAHGTALRYARTDAEGRIATAVATDPRNDTPLEIDGRVALAALDADAQLMRVAGTSLSEVHLRGGASLIGGRTFFAPWIQQSYALVRTGYAGVPVRLNNVEVGTTDRHGDLFLPSLAPLRTDTVSIDPSSLPMGVEVETERALVPFPRAGIPIRFATVSSGAVRFRLVLADGSDAPAGATLAYGPAAAPRETVVAEKGLVYLDGVTPGSVTVRLAFPGTACAASVRVPAAVAQAPDLGTVSCR